MKSFYTSHQTQTQFSTPKMFQIELYINFIQRLHCNFSLGNKFKLSLRSRYIFFFPFDERFFTAEKESIKLGSNEIFECSCVIFHAPDT